MIVNVAQLLKSDVGGVRYHRFDDWLLPFSDDVKLTEPVRGSAELIKTNRGILARGHFTTAVELECSRCLDMAIHDLSIDFTEEFIPVIDVVTGLPAKIPHDSTTYLINERHELDLEQAVREYGLLELPMQPLCRADCAGLCPQCGANRNEAPCHCVVEEQDDRLAVLRALLSPEEERG